MLDVFRVLVVIFLVLHGIGHLIWFMAAWTPVRAGVGDGPWILPGNVTIRSPLGKVLGLLALLAMVAFVLSAIALLLQELWWAGLTNIGIFLSFGAVVPWLRQSPGSSAINAIVADLVLMFVITLFAVDLAGVTA